MILFWPGRDVTLTSQMIPIYHTNSANPCRILMHQARYPLTDEDFRFLVLTHACKLAGLRDSHTPPQRYDSETEIKRCRQFCCSTGKVPLPQVSVCSQEGRGVPYLHPIILSHVPWPFWGYPSDWSEVYYQFVTQPQTGGYPSPRWSTPWPVPPTPSE